MKNMNFLVCFSEYVEKDRTCSGNQRLVTFGGIYSNNDLSDKVDDYLTYLRHNPPSSNAYWVVTSMVKT